MRWTLGAYELNYNPSDNKVGHTSDTQITVGANGYASNANKTYSMSMDFTINLYEKPSYLNSVANISFSSGYYIALAEKRTNDRMFLLRSDGKIDIRDKNGGNQTIVVITVGSVGTLPATLPISIAHMDSELALLYKESSSQVILLITDENGVGKRKYIYNNTYGDNINDITSVAWNTGSYLYALNPYGKVYLVNKNDGTYNPILTFSEYDTNYSSSLKRYTSIMCYFKQSKLYLAYIMDNKYLYFRDGSTFDIGCMGEIPDINMKAMSFGAYSGDFMLLTSVGMYNAHYNTCPLDISIITNVLSEGFVEVKDESGISRIIDVSSMNVTRQRNKLEARYVVAFSGNLIYRNKSFNGGWTYITR